MVSAIITVMTHLLISFHLTTLLLLIPMFLSSFDAHYFMMMKLLIQQIGKSSRDDYYQRTTSFTLYQFMLFMYIRLTNLQWCLPDLMLTNVSTSVHHVPHPLLP